MKFRLLGPLAFQSGDAYHSVRSARQRKILAALLLNVNTPVSIDRLVDILWEQAPPKTARQQVQNCVGMLKRLLSDKGETVTIISRSSGYAMEVAENEIDYLQFRQFVDIAFNLTKSGETIRAVRLLRKAISLWRGQPLEDIDSQALLADAVQLEELRLQAYETLVDLEFIRGHHQDVIADLTSWVYLRPYHEGLHVRLAKALHEVARTAEALQVIRSLRTRLYRDLAIEPGLAIKRVEEHLLEVTTKESGRVGAVSANDELVHAVKTAVIQLSTILEILNKGNSKLS